MVFFSVKINSVFSILNETLAFIPIYHLTQAFSNFMYFWLCASEKDQFSKKLFFPLN